MMRVKIFSHAAFIYDVEDITLLSLRQRQIFIFATLYCYYDIIIDIYTMLFSLLSRY